MNRKTLAALPVLLGILLLFGCAQKNAPSGSAQPLSSSPSEGVYQKISPEEARRMMDESGGFILLDVRTQEEFSQGHIEGAQLLPNDEIGERAQEELPDKNAVILVYCRSGRRSAEAAHRLIDMGYTNIYDFGGILDWPYGTVGGGN